MIIFRVEEAPRPARMPPTGEQGVSLGASFGLSYHFFKNNKFATCWRTTNQGNRHWRGMPCPLLPLLRPHKAHAGGADDEEGEGAQQAGQAEGLDGLPQPHLGTTLVNVVAVLGDSLRLLVC